MPGCDAAVRSYHGSCKFCRNDKHAVNKTAQQATRRAVNRGSARRDIGAAATEPNPSARWKEASEGASLAVAQPQVWRAHLGRSAERLTQVLGARSQRAIFRG